MLKAKLSIFFLKKNEGRFVYIEKKCLDFCVLFSTQKTMWQFGSHLPFRMLFFRADIYQGQVGIQSKKEGGRKEGRERERAE